MGRTETSSEDAERAARIEMFGERGMDHRPEPRARMPLAAGLFGVASPAADRCDARPAKAFERAVLA